MIFTERTITVVNDSATINKPLILYRGDKNIELKITIAESQFKFRNNDASNVIETTDASYAQLVINTPYNSPIFSDVAATKNGAVIFVITEAMIDEIREVGAYEIQIRLLDDNKQSRASIPSVSNAIEIREPIAIEDGSVVDSNAVNVAKVNRALTTTSAPLEAFDSQGNYIKKTWGDGDPITDAALNKMEAGIDGVNKKIANVNSQIKEKANKNDLEVERKRIDNLVSLPDGSTTGDAELIDARISADAIVYDSVGSAIREQYNKLNTTLDNQMYGCEMIINYSNLPILSNGYVKGSGGVSTGRIDLSSTSHKIVTIPIKHLKSIKLQRGSSEVSSSMVYGDIYDSENSTVYYSFNTTNVDELVTIADEWRNKSQLRLNWFNYSTSPYVNSCYIDYINVKDIATDIASGYEKENYNIYNHCVDKPFTFENKSALFFGDSITKGYTNSSTITGNGFPKLLSDKLGMTYRNYGVGGSCLSYDYNNLGSILDKIKSVGSLTSDFLFVAGGVNDWQTATDLVTFKNGVVDICEYLSANYNGKVIFITPINHAGRTPISTPVADLQQYRNIITETVLKYSSFSVVQGNLIPMPNEKSSDEYKTAMFGDKLHPTELGYTVYARALVTILG